MQGHKNMEHTKVLKDLPAMRGSMGDMNYFEFMQASGLKIGLSINSNPKQSASPFFFRIRLIINTSEIQVGSVADLIQKKMGVSFEELIPKFIKLRRGIQRVSFIVEAKSPHDMYASSLPLDTLKNNVIAELEGMMKEVVKGLSNLNIRVGDNNKEVLKSMEKDLYILSFGGGSDSKEVAVNINNVVPLKPKAVDAT